MRQTKRTIGTIACLVLFLTSCDEKPIPVEQLPTSAMTYVKENYPNGKILIAKKDYEGFSKIYEVKLDNGIELTFDNDGNVIDVDD